MAGTVVVQVLVGVLTAGSGNHAGAANEAVHQECHLVGIGAKGFQDEIGARAHLIVVVSGDVGGENLGLAGFVLGALHRVVHQRVNLLRRAEHLVALGFVVLDEVATQPELVSGVGERLRTQTQLGLDDGAGNVATVFHRTIQNAPQVGDVLGRAIEQLDCALGEIDVVNLAVLDIAHALVVTDNQGQHGDNHHAAVGDVAVEQVDRIRNAHIFGGFVDVIHQRVHALGEVVGGRDFDVGAGRRFSGEVSSRLKVAVARLGLHLVGDQNVAFTLDQVFLFQAEVGITCGLIHCVAPAVDKQGFRSTAPESNWSRLYRRAYIINIKLL